MSAPILLLVLLLAVALPVGAYVLWPLLRRASDGPDADAAAISRSVLRERRREIETALAHLPADAPERRAALAEFAAQADEELGSVPPAAAPAAPPRRRPWAAAALAVLLLVPSFWFYLMAGAPDAASPELQAEVRPPANLDELAAQLRTRLAREPKELDGWRLLGRVELARGRPAEARDAYARALELAPGDAQAKVDLADATAQAQGAVLEGRPIELIREALATDPRNPKALALAGAYEVGRRDFPAAIRLWTTLLEVLPTDSEQAKQVAGFLDDLKGGRMPRVAAPQADASGAAGAPPAGVLPPAAPGPSAGAPGATTATPGGSPDAARGPGPVGSGPGAPTGAAPGGPPVVLRGRVELERRLADRLKPDDTLFVVARTLDDTGRPVGPPVAVLRGRGADLPLEFTLDDRLAMSPAARLSAVPAGTQVVVIARLSRSGEAAAKAGDLQGASTPVRAGAAGVRVLIDTVID